jgi:hypothetical protein
VKRPKLFFGLSFLASDTFISWPPVFPEHLSPTVLDAIAPQNTPTAPTQSIVSGVLPERSGWAFYDGLTLATATIKTYSHRMRTYPMLLLVMAFALTSSLSDLAIFDPKSGVLDHQNTLAKNKN